MPRPAIRSYRIRCTAEGTSARGEYDIWNVRGQWMAEARAIENFRADCEDAAALYVPPREEVRCEVLAVL